MLKFYRATVYFCPPGIDIEKSIPFRSGPVRTLAEADAILDSLCQQQLPCGGKFHGGHIDEFAGSRKELAADPGWFQAANA